MLRVAGVTFESGDDIHQVDTLQQKLELAKKDTYFRRSKDHYLLKWTFAALTRLAVKKNDCAFKHDCNPPNESSVAECPRHVEVYRNIKAMFCRTWENRGDHFRFSIRRFVCMIEAAAEGKCKVTNVNECNVRAWDEKGYESKFWSDSDPTKDIASFVNQLAKFEKSGTPLLSGIEIIPKAPTSQAGGKVIINVSFSTLLNSDEKGRDSAHARDCLKRLHELEFTGKSSISGSKTLQIGFTVSLADERLAFTCL